MSSKKRLIERKEQGIGDQGMEKQSQLVDESNSKTFNSSSRYLANIWWFCKHMYNYCLYGTTEVLVLLLAIFFVFSSHNGDLTSSKSQNPSHDTNSSSRSMQLQFQKYEQNTFEDNQSETAVDSDSDSSDSDEEVLLTAADISKGSTKKRSSIYIFSNQQTISFLTELRLNNYYVGSSPPLVVILLLLPVQLLLPAVPVPQQLFQVLPRKDMFLFGRKSWYGVDCCCITLCLLLFRNW